LRRPLDEAQFTLARATIGINHDALGQHTAGRASGVYFDRGPGPGRTPLPASPSNLADLDQDGYPDIAEFHSSAQREAFLEWFAAIAEAQFTAPSPAWLPQEQDCAGLLRFAFFEALKPKTAAWFQKFPYLPRVQAPPISAYPLPQIGRAVFRIAPTMCRQAAWWGGPAPCT